MTTTTASQEPNYFAAVARNRQALDEMIIKWYDGGSVSDSGLVGRIYASAARQGLKVDDRVAALGLAA